ncbi:hypothetical protein VTN96DRAFT_5278 [Rasamsonia emersonii]
MALGRGDNAGVRATSCSLRPHKSRAWLLETRKGETTRKERRREEKLGQSEVSISLFWNCCIVDQVSASSTVYGVSVFRA